MTDQSLSDGEIDYRLALRSAARNYNRVLVATAVAAVLGFALLATTVAFAAGVLYVVGLGLGVFNSQLVQRSLARAVTGGDVQRKAIAFGVLRRLAIVTAVAVAIALAYRPYGWLVFMGLTLFQLLLMLMLFTGLARQVRRA
jgi:hypothetical protein